MADIRQWVGSRRHRCASMLALLGPLLLFTGYIHHGWWLITAGLYALGWLACPPAPAFAPPLRPAPTLADLLSRQQQFLQQHGPQLPIDAQECLQHLLASITALLPVLQQRGADHEDVQQLHHLLADYLPQTLQYYLTLPAEFRHTQPLQDGQTASMLLQQQLQWLQDAVQQALQAVARGEAQALLLHGRFLQQRLQPPAEFFRVD